MTTQIAEPAAEPEKETKSRHKVLIVDGEEKFLEAAVKVFHAVGLETTVSQDPHKALDVLRSEGPFSVVLANSKMDEMEGPEFLCKVKKLHPVTVRILTTASLDGQEVEELVNQGEAYRFLKRPLDYKLLVKSVQESLRKHDENLAQISNAKAVESLKKKYIAAQAEILKLQGRVKKWRLWVALVVMSVFLCGLTFGGIQWLSQRLEKKELKDTSLQEAHWTLYRNRTALDTKTGLMWMTVDFRNMEKRSPRHWKEILLWRDRLNENGFAGYTDWRIPTIAEYKATFDPEHTKFAYDQNKNFKVGYPKVFEDGGGYGYWSQDTTNEENAKYFFFIGGYSKTVYRDFDSPTMSVRLVRQAG